MTWTFPRSLRPLLLATSLGTLLLPSTLPAAEKSSLEVKISTGKIVGKLSGDVRTFLGIPYAAPPVGPLRWKAPQPVEKWKGVRDASQFGAHCMQPKLYADMIFRDPGNSEDCLTLNIWTPAKDKSAKLPVMVWIYGGGYITGGTSEPRQDGTNLAAKHNVIVVSMNYRLGVFGFFAHAGLDAESGHGSGNYGLQDQTAALRWVQQNIATFGGDPANVTIFGESAGSFAVSSQMASPLAKGLFHRAIGESGGAFNSHGLGTQPLKVAEQKDADFAQDALNVTTLDQLRAVPAQQLMDAAFKKPESGPGYHFAPVVDGYFFPEDAPAIFAAHHQNDVDLLAGWNHDEGGVATGTTVDTLKTELTKLYPDHADQAIATYTASTDDEAVRALSDARADQFIAYSTWRWIESQVATGKHPVFRYRFDLAPPADPNHPGGLAAYHSAEIPYVFGNLDLLQGFSWRPEDYKLSEQMQTYWTNFARTGDPNAPNGPDLPKWPTYNPTTSYEVLYLSPNTQAAPDKTRSHDLFLDSLWAPK
jgi:para-nitrobenzyl esterase